MIPRLPDNAVCIAEIPRGVVVTKELMHALIDAHRQVQRPLTEDEVLALMPAASESVS